MEILPGEPDKGGRGRGGGENAVRSGSDFTQSFSTCRPLWEILEYKLYQLGARSGALKTLLVFLPLRASRRAAPEAQCRASGEACRGRQHRKAHRGQGVAHAGLVRGLQASWLECLFCDATIRKKNVEGEVLPLEVIHDRHEAKKPKPNQITEGSFRGYFPTPINSSTSAGYPMIPLHSDSSYLDLVSDPSTQFHHIVPSPDASPRSQVATCALAHWLHIGGSQDPFFRFDNLLGWRTEHTLLAFTGLL